MVYIPLCSRLNYVNVFPFFFERQWRWLSSDRILQDRTLIYRLNPARLIIKHTEYPEFSHIFNTGTFSWWLIYNMRAVKKSNRPIDKLAANLSRSILSFVNSYLIINKISLYVYFHSKSLRPSMTTTQLKQRSVSTKVEVLFFTECNRTIWLISIQYY